jgi:hypothetical protein
VLDRPARSGTVEISAVSDGYVVYDPERDRVHYLNHTAALVLELCTGANSTSDIIGTIQRCYELPDPPDGEVRDCLDHLRREELVTDGAEPSSGES